MCPNYSAPITHLTSSGKLTGEALRRAERIAVEAGEFVEPVLTRLGLVSERDMAAAFAEALKLPIADTKGQPIDGAALASLSPIFLRQFHVLPQERTHSGLGLAMANPQDDYAPKAIGLVLGCPVHRRVATQTDIDAVLDQLFQPETPPDDNGNSSGSDVERLRDLASDAPVIRLVNQIIAHAVDTRASDIHIEPAVNRLIVRNRIDGVMIEVDAPPLRLREAVISRVKIMARLNIAERRLPQDGRMSTSVRGTEIDFRVSTVPTVHGESVVIRVLDRDCKTACKSFQIPGINSVQ